MTTIATDGVTIAADSSGFFDTIRAVRPCVKIIVSREAIYALCGSNAMRMPVLAWIESGGAVPDMPTCSGADWAMLAITKTGALMYSSEMPFPTQISYPFAMGSGEKFAYGAMAAGAEPKEAIAIAARFDAHTGGAVDVVNIAEALGPSLLLAADGKATLKKAKMRPAMLQDAAE